MSENEGLGESIFGGGGGWMVSWKSINGRCSVVSKAWAPYTKLIGGVIWSLDGSVFYLRLLIFPSGVITPISPKMGTPTVSTICTKKQ